jgi:hypothetical protein
MAAKNRVSSAASSPKTDTSAGPTNPDEFRTETWKIRSEISPKIPDIQTDTSAIDGYYAAPTPPKGEHKEPPPSRAERFSAEGLSSRATMPILSSEDNAARIKWARDVAAWASKLGVELRTSSMQVNYTDHDWVLRFVTVSTQAAGYLLGATERLLLEPIDDSKPAMPPAAPAASQLPPAASAPAPASSGTGASPHPHPGGGGPPPHSPASAVVDVELSLAAYACVLTARDHVVAAEQALQNLRKMISNRETGYLVCVLGASVLAYTMFHPTWGFFLKLSVSVPIWEVIWWSLFGAVAASYIRVNEDTETDTFDSRHPFRYVYRIVTAPLVAVVIVYLWTVIGVTLSSSSAASSLTLGTGTLANTATLIVVSFLLGFFSKEALDILKNAWQNVKGQSTTSKQSTS